MPGTLILALYLVVGLYAAVTYVLGPYIPLATIVLGFGMLVVPYLMLEWVLTPAVALLTGFQARWWSVPAVILLGSPLVVLFTVVTPVVSSGSQTLAVPVPWMAVHAKGTGAPLATIRERLVWWGSLHGLGLLAGWASRRFPTARDGTVKSSPDDTMEGDSA